ncbi:hypothetical protein [Pedococcus bigeumensis]|uniref:hypothetical protein n=1 Tax=Pedococcus bigeumensis TaxID=433644 RepID=UPI002FE82D0F
MAFLLVVAGGSAATVVTSGSALAAGGALTAAAAPQAAPAAPAPNGSCGMASPGTGPYASTLCWLDMTSYNIVAAATGQQITESLPGGYTATFTLTVTGPRALSAYPFPTFSQAYLGTGSYTGVPGKPALYQGLWNSGLGTSAAQNSSTINLSNIVVTDSAGNRVTNYSLVSADAESTDYPSNVAYPESFTWTSDQPFTSLQPLGNSCGGGFTGVGTTTVTCTGGGAGSQQRKTGNAILATTNPSTLTAVVQASASRQGVAFGFLFESVTLNKTVVNAYGGDSFTVDVTGSNGTLQGTASTAPGGASATTGPVTVIGDTAGSMVTLSETAAAANVGTYTPA